MRLRRLRVADLPAFQAYRGDEEVGRWQGWQPMSANEAQAFLREMATLPFAPPGDWFQLAIARRDDDALIGDMGLHLHADGRTLELGFTLARAAQGQGLAAEAVKLALARVFAHTPARRVLAITDTRNAASVRLLRRLGFRPLATLPALFRGEPCLEHHFVLHRPGRGAVTLRPAGAVDAAAVAEVLIEARRVLMPFAPSAHPPDEVRAWVAQQLVPGGGVTLAEVLLDGGPQVVGVLATAVREGRGWIDQLSVHPEHVGTGAGGALLAHALATLPRPLRLFTFQANLHARAFYERHGFVALAFGDGSGNEERCPDVLYERAAEVPCPP